jgi:hypothetical protein
MRRVALARVSPFTLVAAALLLAAVSALVVYDARYHEFWRDEAHIYVFNGRVPLHRLLLAKKVEGQPPLYDLVTMPLRGFVSPLGRALVGAGVSYALLLYGTYRCLFSICRREVASLVLTCLFGATYIYAYEYGVVVRVYAMGAGFALLTSAYLRDALRGHSVKPVVLGTLCAGLSLITSTHASTLAAGAVAAFGLVSLWRHRGIKLALPTLGVLPFLAILVYEIAPFPGRSPELNVDLHHTAGDFAKLSLQAVAGSFTPQDWWVTTSFGDPSTLDTLALLRHWGQRGAIAALALLLAMRLAPAYRHYRTLLAFDLLSIFIGWAGLLVVIVNHYWGSPRHHIFLSLPALVLAAGWAAQPRFGPHRWASAVAFPLLFPWLAFELWVSARDLKLDVDLPFSDTKAAAAFLPADAHLVADSLTIQEAYMFWQPGIVMRGGDSAGRRTGYLAFDNAWHWTAPVEPMVREECAAAPDRTYFSGAPYSLGSHASCLRLLKSGTPHSEQLRADERFDLFQVDCACVSSH